MVRLVEALMLEVLLLLLSERWGLGRALFRALWRKGDGLLREFAK